MEAVILMTLVIVGIISFCMTVSILARNAITSYLRRNKEKRTGIEKWMDGHAEILTMKRTGNYIGALPEILMNVRIVNESGQSLTTVVCNAFSFMEILAIREEGKVPVKYNPADPCQVSFRKINRIVKTIHSSKSAFRYANSAVH